MNLRVSVEDGAYTTETAADEYTYASPAIDAPTISSLSPPVGAASGGTKVTIHGSNFTGVKSVTFGGKAGTKLDVTSATEFTVTTPAGSNGKTVNVVVTAAGGTSNTVLYLYT